MDVSSLNNFLVLLRPSVRRAQLYLCRKNTRRVRELRQKRVANQQQKEQNERKASRMLKEIEFVRKVHINDLAKQLIKYNPNRRRKEDASQSDASKTEKSQTDASQTEMSSSEMWTRVLPKLWSMPFVKSPIESFLLKLPNGRVDLNPLMQSLGKKQRQKSSGVKKQKALKTKVFNKELISSAKESKKSHQETLKELKERNRRQRKEDNRFDSKVFGEKKEKVANKIAEINLQRSKERQEDKLRKSKAKEDVQEDKSDESREDDDEEDEVDSDDGAEEKRKFDRREGEVEVQTLDLNQSSDENESNKTKDEEVVNNSNTETLTKSAPVIRDSFFVGGQSASEDEQDDDEEDDQEEMEQLTAQLGSKTREERRKNFNVRREVPYKGEFRAGFKKKSGFKAKSNGPRTKSGFNNYSKERDVGHKSAPKVPRGAQERFGAREAPMNKRQNSEAVSRQLHPSWEAKRGTQKQILPFKGTKVVFDD